MKPPELHKATKKPANAAHNPQRGAVMILAMLLLVGLMAVSISVSQRTVRNSDQTRRGYQEERVFYAAEGGAEVATAWLNNVLAANPNPSQEILNALAAPTLPGFEFVELSITKQPLIAGGQITQGPFAGMTADIQPYTIRSHAANSNSSVEKIVQTSVNQEAVGLYQFGIYYDGDLEFFTEYPLNYAGRIHTNGDLYLGSSNVLNIDGQVTAGGNVYNTPKDAARTYHGKARLKDQADHWQDLRYDSRDPNWVERSLDDWQGRLLDSSHSAGRLPFPLPTPANPIEIIKRGLPGDNAELQAKRFFYKAGLRIVDGIAKDSAGNPVVIPPGIFSNSIFYDYREQRNMTLLDLNMAALIGSGLVPVNRIIYISNAGASAALRIRNAATLPAGGLTIATDNPVYVEGHYNTVSKKPASILCDAFNVLSINWDDANAAKPLNKRLARATTVNTCVVAGNTTTTDGHYNGGAENLIRLHEKWVGHELTYRGSLICLWESDYATGDFNNASYVEAHRDWGFDPDLLDPAFWPRDAMALNRIARGGWSSH